MKIHEFQAKAIFRKHGVAVPRGEAVSSAEGAREAALRLGGRCVVKAQIHAGGRGKAGGVKVAGSADEAAELAGRMLGSVLVTPQTGPAGREVHRVLIEEPLEIAREVYLALALDRAAARLALIGCREGGVEIEAIAAASPGSILRERIDPAAGLLPFQARRLAFGLGFGGDAAKEATRLIQALARCAEQSDASLAEINPLVTTKDGKVLALDGKMILDDNALYRHPDLMELRDPHEEDPLELKASASGLNYVKLDGEVGCMVNGAGLAMATMDIVKLAGGSPANFLDVGGGASAEQVAQAFEILVSDPAVRAVLINIFGGILRCDRLATGVVEAARKVGVRIPIVVRMEGTNVAEGRRILAESGLRLIVAEGMGDAAQKAVAAARSGA